MYPHKPMEKKKFRCTLSIDYTVWRDFQANTGFRQASKLVEQFMRRFNYEYEKQENEKVLRHEE